MIGRLYAWIDDRLAFSGEPGSAGGRKIISYIFPDHWSFMLGEIALYAFAVLVVTGVFLALYFVPSTHTVVYHGIYTPLDGERMPECYQSVLYLSFHVRAGLLMRQTHHWAADVFLGAITVHMARIFFTGAFRRPRELNFLVGASLLGLAMLNGYFGYSLPDDLLSGMGVRIGFSIFESVPVIGQYLTLWFFGGNFPGPEIEQRFYILHVFVFPLLIFALIGVHLALIIRPHHTQFPGKGRSERNVVGTPALPAYAMRSQGFFFIVFGVLFMLGGLAEIDQIWKYGPFEPYRASYASQPDWYLGWLEGILRIFPAWETNLPGHMIPEQFWAAVFIPLMTWGLFYSYPFLEARLTGDRAEHHLLDHPRDRPVRTAFGCAVFAFYADMFLAASDDVLSHWFKVTLENMVWFFRVGLLLIPATVFLVTYKLCKELQLKAQAYTSVERRVLVARRPDGSFDVVQVVPTDGAAKHPEEEPASSGG